MTMVGHRVRYDRRVTQTREVPLIRKDNLCILTILLSAVPIIGRPLCYRVGEETRQFDREFKRLSLGQPEPRFHELKHR